MSSSKARQLIEHEFSDPFQPSHQNGPDFVIPTTECRTWIPEGATKIEFNKDTFDRKPESIVTFFHRTVKEYPDHYAMMIKRNNEWQKWTYKQYWNEVRVVAKGFIKLGLLPFHGVGILGCNAPEWFITHLATIFSGGFGAGIYTTNSPEACYHILNDCEANIVVIDNEIQLNKILKIRDKLPNLKAIVQYIGTPTHPDVFSWNDVIEIGRSVPDDVLEKRIKGLAVNQCCTLIYTSGTTGNSKGVMLSHDNMVFEITYFYGNGRGAQDVNGSCVSYLPLSHIGAMFSEEFAPMFCAATVYFAPADALKGNLVDTVAEVKPVYFGGVPRIYEKMYEKITTAEHGLNFVQRNLLSWAKNEARKYHAIGEMKPTRKPLLLMLANKLVLEKIKKLLGLEQTKYVGCAGAPLSKDVQQYFLELDLPIFEGYGLSETCGIHIFSGTDNVQIGSVGNVTHYPACEIKIDKPNENGCGELLLRGRNICMGYLKLKDKTIELIDDEHWLYSGDEGTIDNNGLLRITGRIKELIITSGGENIPPLIIEDEIKRNLPIISNCVLIGEMKKYLTMLITFKTDLSPETNLPTDLLSLPALRWCKKIGSSATTVSQIIKDNDKHVMAAIQAGVDKYNKEKAISSAQRVQKWAILPLDFSTQTGELGPTAKLKRPFIVEKYSKEIDKIYS